MTEHPSTLSILARSAISTAFAIAQPVTIDFENLWVKALISYKKQTGCNIYQDQAALFPDDPSVDNIVSILETQSKGLKAFWEKGKNICSVLTSVVNLVRLFNDTGAEAAAAASVPEGKAIFVAFRALLVATKGVTEVYNALVELSEKLQDALDHIKWHLDANSKLSSMMKEIYIQMLVQVLHVFTFLIKYQDSNAKKPWNMIWQCSKDFGKSLLREKEVQEALQKLDKLTNREALMEIGEIHNKVYNIDIKVDNLDAKMVETQSELLIVTMVP
ncbi:hypothetical protein GYMLUDRAFT_244577 [Collybiopsis luxurians FD-317 M1]|uniref:Fungal STAND N-terminal Goodbye domain-containing protein n=1 Tax=Collybiopsis luxurians FD-317 M1 TaxID=944289 RepID=A0A0D0CCA5_9AGAR|nr:hypothetical protein GYMLUDRAFT_244577 [Collybiopsis luxurians FD-317 M1]